MTRADARRRLEDRGLVLVGVTGLAVAAIIACCADDADSGSDKTSDAGKTVSDAGTKTSDSGVATGATADCEQTSSTQENTAAVVTAAEAFVAALSDDQKKAVQLDKTLANAQKWSNFPTTFVPRNGLKLSDMSSDARDKAVALAEVAAGSTGATLFSELRAADEFLVTDGKAASTDYGENLYYFSIHGTPSTSAAWMLQIGGHHLAYNFMYNGKCTSATPLFDGVEPTTWTDTNGKEHAPLEAQRAAMVELLAAVSSKSDAKLSGTFGDLVNGPAGGGPGGSSGGGSVGDSKYPAGLTYPSGTSGRGVSVAALSSNERALVKSAIEAWVKNVADPISSALLASYESDDALAHTYVGYSGSADLSTQSSYVRIDGPRVWIEVTVQGGIVYHDRVHYHTIWRDKVADYGAEFDS